jgi:hypothetical protein
MLILFHIPCKGILAGLYLIIQWKQTSVTNEIVQNEKTSYFITYKFYSDLVTFLSQPQKWVTNRADETKNRKSTNSTTRSFQASTTAEFNQATFFPSTPSTNIRFSLSSENITDELNFEAADDEDTNFGFEVIDDFDETPVSNSKQESEINEIIDLIVRDFILKWIENLIWENEKFFSMTK